MAAVNTDEGKVILEGVSWETYERLLSENQGKKGTRFAYDQGSLEIMVVSFEHDSLSRKIGLLVELIAAEMEMDIEVSGSTTFKREDLFKGFEPDESFYIREPKRVRGKKEIELAEDPPPDLVIEVDVSTRSLNKLPLFSAIGIAEVWRYSKGNLRILKRNEAGYIETPISLLLPEVSSSILNEFIERSQTLERNVWVREIRDWARKAGSKES